VIQYRRYLRGALKYCPRTRAMIKLASDRTAQPRRNCTLRVAAHRLIVVKYRRTQNGTLPRWCASRRRISSFLAHPPFLIKAALSERAVCICGRNAVVLGIKRIVGLNLWLESDLFGPGIGNAVQVKEAQSSFCSDYPKLEASYVL